MKCKFEHDGDCCNSGAVQYMCKCKQPFDTISPMTNADRIRAMTDEELAEWLCDRVSCTYCKDEMQGIDTCLMCVNQVYGVLNWLQQPCGGADHDNS